MELGLPGRGTRGGGRPQGMWIVGEIDRNPPIDDIAVVGNEWAWHPRCNGDGTGFLPSPHEIGAGHGPAS